jgi:hypothetical protein
MARKCSVQKYTPRAVALERPTMPPRSSGLPVTTGRLLVPRCIIENVS